MLQDFKLKKEYKEFQLQCFENKIQQFDFAILSYIGLEILIIITCLTIWNHFDRIYEDIILSFSVIMLSIAFKLAVIHKIEIIKQNIGLLSQIYQQFRIFFIVFKYYDRDQQKINPIILSSQYFAIVTNLYFLKNQMRVVYTQFMINTIFAVFICYKEQQIEFDVIVNFLVCSAAFYKIIQMSQFVDEIQINQQMILNENMQNNPQSLLLMSKKQIVFANKNFYKLLNMKEQQVSYLPNKLNQVLVTDQTKQKDEMNFNQLLVTIYDKYFESPTSNECNDDQVFKIEYQENKQRKNRIVQISVSKSFYLTDQSTALIFQINDITRYQQEQLKSLLNKQVKNFTKMSKHELGNVLNAQLLSISMIKEFIPKIEQSQNLYDLIYWSTQQFKITLQSIKFFDQMNNNDFKNNCQIFDYWELIEDFISKLKIFAKSSKNVEIKVEYQMTEFKTKIYCDFEKFSQIIFTLIFFLINQSTSDKGLILLQNQSNEEKCTIIIRSKSLFLDQNYIDKMFQFNMQDDNYLDEYGGINLYICRKMVKLFDGYLKCESNKKYGTAFKLQISKSQGCQSLNNNSSEDEKEIKSPLKINEEQDDKISQNQEIPNMETKIQIFSEDEIISEELDKISYSQKIANLTTNTCKKLISLEDENISQKIQIQSNKATEKQEKGYQIAKMSTQCITFQEDQNNQTTEKLKKGYQIANMSTKCVTFQKDENNEATEKQEQGQQIAKMQTKCVTFQEDANNETTEKQEKGQQIANMSTEYVTLLEDESIETTEKLEQGYQIANMSTKCVTFQEDENNQYFQNNKNVIQQNSRKLSIKTDSTHLLTSQTQVPQNQNQNQSSNSSIEDNTEQECTNSDCAKLIFIDDQFIINMANQILAKSLNVKSDTAVNGEKGLTMIQKSFQRKCQCGPYKLVITDLNMPVMNGIEMIRNLRLLFQEKLNIAVLSGGLEIETESHQFQQYNIQHLYNKPISKETLSQLINSYLDIQSDEK